MSHCRIRKGLGGNESPDFHLHATTDKSAGFWDGSITHKLWSPSELCSSSQTSNDKTFIAPQSTTYCVQTLYFVWYFSLKSLLLIFLFMQARNSRKNDVILRHKVRIHPEAQETAQFKGRRFVLWFGRYRHRREVGGHGWAICCSTRNAEQILGSQSVGLQL